MKCVVFAFVVILLFFTKPHICLTENRINIFLTAYILFFVSYVSMAIYDEIMFKTNNCDIGKNSLLRKSRSGGFTSEFKHNRAKVRSLHQIQEQSATGQKTNAEKAIIYLSHMLFISPLLIYLIIYGLPPFKRGNATAMHVSLSFLAIMTFLYHSSHLFSFFSDMKQQDRFFHLKPNEAKHINWQIILDVRTHAEKSYDTKSPPSLHMPLSEILSLKTPDDFKNKLGLGQNTNVSVLVFCRTGRRAEKAAKHIRQIGGYSNVYSLDGNLNSFF